MSLLLQSKVSPLPLATWSPLSQFSPLLSWSLEACSNKPQLVKIFRKKSEKEWEESLVDQVKEATQVDTTLLTRSQRGHPNTEKKVSSMVKYNMLIKRKLIHMIILRANTRASKDRKLIQTTNTKNLPVMAPIKALTKQAMPRRKNSRPSGQPKVPSKLRLTETPSAKKVAREAVAMVVTRSQWGTALKWLMTKLSQLRTKKPSRVPRKS